MNVERDTVIKKNLILLVISSSVKEVMVDLTSPLDIDQHFLVARFFVIKHELLGLTPIQRCGCVPEHLDFLAYETDELLNLLVSLSGSSPQIAIQVLVDRNIFSVLLSALDYPRPGFCERPKSSHL